MLHPDGQYEPSLIPKLVAPILDGEADLVLGSRLPEPGAALAGGMPRWKYVANRVLTTIENRDPRHRTSPSCTPATAPTRASCCSRSRGCATRSTSRFDSELLMQAVHFGFRIEEVPARTIYSDDASSVGCAPATVYGAEDAVGGGAARACTGAGCWRVAEVPAVSRSPASGWSTAGGRLQPDLAAPRRHLPAVRAAAARRAACSTSAAASGTRSTSWRRARRSASTSTPRRWRGRTARPWSPTCARCRSRTATLRLRPLGPVDRARARPRAGARRGRARAASPAAPRSSSRPTGSTFARPDEIIDPYHYVEFDPSSCARSARPYFEEVEVLGLFGLRPLPGAGRGRARAARPAAAHGPAAAAPARPAAPAAPLRLDADAQPQRRRPARRRSRPTTSSCARRGRGAFDLVAVCSGPRRAGRR